MPPAPVATPPPAQLPPPRPVQSPAAAPVVLAVQEQPSALQTVAFWVLCAYLVSGILNDWMLRLVGIKGYVSVVTLILLPCVWLLSGAALRGFRTSIGIWWALFAVFLIVDVPFSIWRGGSFDLLINYIPRSYLQMFFVASLSYSLMKCRQIMYVNAIVSFMALLACAAFGSYSSDGRYMVQGGAGFFANSNELAMQLLMGITQFVYVFSQKSVIGKFIAAAGIAGSIPYILSTGSRGCTLAAIAYAGLLVYTSRKRVLALIGVGMLALIGLVFASSGALQRVVLLFGDDSDSAADQSRISRIELLTRSLTATVTHPITGVGPGQFPVYISERAKEKGEWAQWLGTHNAYTQVSSECGIPAFICYFAVNILCVTVNFRLWRFYRDRAGGSGYASLSLALLSGTLVYSVCSFFFHMAYTGALPLLAGQTVALYLAAKEFGAPAVSNWPDFRYLLSRTQQPR